MGGAAGRSGPPGNRNSIRHGYYSLIKLVQSRHGVLDKRTVLGKMVTETVRQLEADLGGDLSTAQKMLVHDVAIDTLLLQGLQARLDIAPIRKGKIHAVYTLRAQLVAQRREHLKLLGLKRVPRDLNIHSVDRELLAEKAKQQSGTDDAAESGNGSNNNSQVQ